MFGAMTRAMPPVERQDEGIGWVITCVRVLLLSRHGEPSRYQPRTLGLHVGFREFKIYDTMKNGLTQDELDSMEKASDLMAEIFNGEIRENGYSVCQCRHLGVVFYGQVCKTCGGVIIEQTELE